MENRIVIKKINFFEQLTRDIKIKLYHNKILQVSDVIWEYENNEIINWKFIIDYEPTIAIDFILLENDVFDENNIIGHGFHINNLPKINKINHSLFPEPFINVINIEKNNIIIAEIQIEQYILLKEDSELFQCGIGWQLPDTFPKLDIFPFKNRNNIFENIRIIEDNYNEESQYDNYSEAFIRVINNIHNKPPMCFGIIAPDNYGKSRLLQNLKNRINNLPNNKSFVVIDFNPWNFESDDTIWASILMSIHDALENKFGLNLKLLRIKRTLFPTRFSFILFLLKIFIPIIIILILYIYDYYSNKISSIILTLSLALSSLFFLKDSIVLIKTLCSTVSNKIYNKITKPDWKNKLGFMNEIKQEFFNFINPAIKEYNCRLILLIDDLDKCSIEKVYLVIKALSLLKYSDCPLYIFLSYDSVKINDAIKSYYKIKHLTNAYEGKDLLDKLITIPFCLPEKNIVENITLLDKYIKASVSKSLSKRKILEIDNDQTTIYFNEKNPDENTLNYAKINQIERNINNHTLSFFHLENYYNYIIKIEKELPTEQKIKDIKNLVYKEFIKIKKDFTNNYYIGLDNDEIQLFQNILEETKYSGKCLNNTQIIKIINMYSIARFLLPNYLKFKKNKLFHLLIITENWSNIIIKIYLEIRKNKINLSIEQVKECFDNKELLFYYLNNDAFTKNDELIIYLSKFEIKIIDFIDLEIYIINLDRCFNTII